MLIPPRSFIKESTFVRFSDEELFSKFLKKMSEMESDFIGSIPDKIPTQSIIPRIF